MRTISLRLQCIRGNQPPGPYHNTIQYNRSLCTCNHLKSEKQTTQASIGRGGVTELALANSTKRPHAPYTYLGNSITIITITNSTNSQETQQSNLCTYRFIPLRYMFRPITSTLIKQGQNTSTKIKIQLPLYSYFVSR